MCVCAGKCHLLMLVLESAITLVLHSAIVGAGQCRAIAWCWKVPFVDVGWCWKVPFVDVGWCWTVPFVGAGERHLLMLVGAGKCHYLVLDSANCGCWKVP